MTIIVALVLLLAALIAGLVWFTANTARKVEAALPPRGRFMDIDGERIHWDGPERVTFGSIAVYDTTLFRELPRMAKLKLLPLLHEWMSHGLVSGELYQGPWANVGTPDELAKLDQVLARG